MNARREFVRSHLGERPRGLGGGERSSFCKKCRRTKHSGLLAPEWPARSRMLRYLTALFAVG